MLRRSMTRVSELARPKERKKAQLKKKISTQLENIRLNSPSLELRGKSMCRSRNFQNFRKDSDSDSDSDSTSYTSYTSADSDASDTSNFYFCDCLDDLPPELANLRFFSPEELVEAVNELCPNKPTKQGCSPRKGPNSGSREDLPSYCNRCKGCILTASRDLTAYSNNELLANELDSLDRLFEQLTLQ